MTKRRGGGKTSSVHFPMKSPASKTPQRTFKHLDFIPLSQIKKVADIKESDGKLDVQYVMTVQSNLPVPRGMTGVLRERDDGRGAFSRSCNCCVG